MAIIDPREALPHRDANPNTAPETHDTLFNKEGKPRKYARIIANEILANCEPGAFTNDPAEGEKRRAVAEKIQRSTLRKSRKKAAAAAAAVVADPPEEDDPPEETAVAKEPEKEPEKVSHEPKSKFAKG